MEILSYIQDLWLRKNSKGTWETKDGKSIYVEKLTDSHLMSIPHFMWKKYFRYTYDYIPDEIKKEIEERGMYIDFNNEFTVKYKKPVVTNTSSKFKVTEKRKHNKIFFK